MRKVAFLTLVALGVAVLLAAVLVVRLSWRDDVRPYGRHVNSFDVLAHPERHARPEVAGLVRGLAVVGVVLLAAALAIVVSEIVGVMSTGR